MKMICDVPDEVIKCIKDGMWCGSHVAEKMIANGIPLSGTQEPCEDAISRQAVIDATVKKNGIWNSITNSKGENLEEIISQLPSVNQQETVSEFADRCRECGKMKRCRDCKYFEYDSLAKVDGVKLIVAHEICSRWGDGCKTSEDGYCFLFEPKMQEVEE